MRYCIIFFFQLILNISYAQINIIVFDQVAETYSPEVEKYKDKKPFYHECIPAANKMLVKMAKQHGWDMEMAADADEVDNQVVKDVDVIIFNNVGGDFLSEKEQNAIEKFIKSGGGFVGIHMATAAERNWEWYHDMLGGVYFTGHPPMQKGLVYLEEKFSEHPLNQGIPKEFEWEDEWYEWNQNPRPNVNVLMTVDESSYEGGKMGEDHPVAWFLEFQGGKIFYTGLGHKPESYSDPLLIKQIENGILYVIGQESNFK